MIYFNISLRHPKWLGRFKSLRNWHGATPIPHKYWEVQIFKIDHLFRFEFGWTTRQDHAGISLELGLLGYEIDFTLYDSRHWDEEQGRYFEISHTT